MEKTPNGWTILDRDTATLTIEYCFNPNGGFANSFVTLIAPGKLMVVSPGVGIATAAMDDLKEFGEVVAIVASNGFHHLGIRSWRDHFPEAKCYAPSKAIPRISKKSEDAGELEPLSNLLSQLSDEVNIYEVPDSKCGELWAYRTSSLGNIWFVSDVLANVAELPKGFLVRMIFKFTKSAPGFKVFHLALNFIVNNKKQVLRDMLETMQKNPPSLVLPAHGGCLNHETVWEDTRELIESTL